MGERFARGPDMDKAANEGLDKRLALKRAHCCSCVGFSSASNPYRNRLRVV